MISRFRLLFELFLFCLLPALLVLPSCCVKRDGLRGLPLGLAIVEAGVDRRLA